MDANNEDVFSLKGHTQRVSSLAFSPEGKRVYAWDEQRKVRAWSVEDGNPVDPADAPPMPPPGPARSPDGFLCAEPRGLDVAVTDTRLVDPKANRWPLPDRAERLRYHGERAALAEKEQRWFAAAFHLGRLLLDDPDSADLKRRHADALKKHAEAAL